MYFLVLWDREYTTSILSHDDVEIMEGNRGMGYWPDGKWYPVFIIARSGNFILYYDCNRSKKTVIELLYLFLTLSKIFKKHKGNEN